MFIYNLDSSDNEILNELITYSSIIMPNEEPELFISQVSNLVNLIPNNVKKCLNKFLKNGSETGFILLQNVMIQEHLPLPNTPPDNNYFIGEKTNFVKVVAILNQYLGQMISYEGEGYGRLFQDMVPKKSLSYTQTSLGSNVELEIHTEQAFSELRPDILTLGCLRGDENAITYILPVNIILNQMDEAKINLLRKPLWKIGVDLSFKINCDEFINGNVRGPIPILYGPENDPLFVFDQDLMKGINEEAENLKNEIIEIYYKFRYSHVLKPGDIIFIDNKHAVHGRSIFKPKFDGNDRFIIRSFITFNIEQSEYARINNKRMIQAKYS